MIDHVRSARDSDAITPNALREMRKATKRSRLAYHAARKAALAVPKSDLIGREDALYEALEARSWAHIEAKRLAAAELLQVVKGANLSPNARARAYANGRWKTEVAS